MSIGLILVIILVIALFGGFSGRFGGYGYGYGHLVGTRYFKQRHYLESGSWPVRSATIG